MSGLNNQDAFRKLLPWPWSLTSVRGIDIEKEREKLLYSIECVKMALLYVKDPATRDRLNRDIQYVHEKIEELQRLSKADDLPDTERGRKQQKTCQNNSSIGGKATAHYTDADVLEAFGKYKSRSSGGAWEAAHALVRPGKELDKWKGNNAGANCYKRFERIAKDKYSLTAKACFEGL